MIASRWPMMSSSAGRGLLSGCPPLSRRVNGILVQTSSGVVTSTRRPSCSRLAIHGTDLPTEYAVDRHAQGGGLAVHRPAPAHHKVGEPDEVQSIDRSRRHDGLVVREPVRVVRAKELRLSLIARQQDSADPWRLGETRHEFHEQNVALGIAVVGFVRRRPDHHDESRRRANPTRSVSKGRA